MSETVVVEATRRRLTSRQAEQVQRLIHAAADEIREARYAGLTVRGVARRAGVAPATAYAYFSSKDHLLAELLYRRYLDLPETAFRRGQTRLARVSAVLKDIGSLLAEDPVLATGGMTGLLGEGEDVRVLRERTSTEIDRRLGSALGADCDPEVRLALSFAYAGVMLAAGMGHLAFERIPERMIAIARLLLPEVT